MTSNSLDLNYLNKQIVKLARILHIENKLLAKFQIEKVSHMQKNKNEIISYLAHSKEKLIKNINNYKDKKVINDIKANLELIELNVQKNMILTQKAINANKKIIEIFTDQLKEVDQIIYNNKGLKKASSSSNLLTSLNLTKV